MLRGDHPWDRFEQFGDAKQRSNQQVGTGNGTFTRRVRYPDLCLAPTEDDDLVG
ncbi:hypothetical protein GGR48_000183 [Sphingomonas pseudosanguinis]|uniref:Uncharacterized protein n=1 Tax=Sphingomonas pseudosanguinis TaxID=413712 RepID=A0A7W6A9F1_9SPHN|nr:hypothetical protein [Sphingomonas pseudosanguinis]